jgi:hypothetical protein
LFRYRDYTAAGSQKQCVIEPCCKDSHPLAFTVLTTCGLDFSMCPLQPPSTLSGNSYGSCMGPKAGHAQREKKARSRRWK